MFRGAYFTPAAAATDLLHLIRETPHGSFKTLHCSMVKFKPFFHGTFRVAARSFVNFHAFGGTVFVMVLMGDAVKTIGFGGTVSLTVLMGDAILKTAATRSRSRKEPATTSTTNASIHLRPERPPLSSAAAWARSPDPAAAVPP
jgi:hypothetical protein